MRILSAIIVALLCLPAFGEPYAGATNEYDDRVVKLSDGGTAAYLTDGERVWLLSCAHRTAYTSIAIGQRIGYSCHDDSQGVATVVAVDPVGRGDCSILSIDKPPAAGVIPYTMSTTPARRGDTVWVAGFPMGNYRCRTATVQVDNGGNVFLAGGATPGESGGPVTNANGQVVGVLTADIDGRQTMCSGRAPIRGLWGQIQTGSVLLASNCEGGNCGPPPGYWSQPERPQRPRPPADRPALPAPPQASPPNGGTAPPYKPPVVQPPAQPATPDKVIEAVKPALLNINETLNQMSVEIKQSAPDMSKLESGIEANTVAMQALIDKLDGMGTAITQSQTNINQQLTQLAEAAKAEDDDTAAPSRQKIYARIVPRKQ